MVIEKLKKIYPEYQFKKVIITTKGDTDRTSPIYEFGGKAVFVEDIEKALLDGTIDMAVHSAKDMPNPCANGLRIAGTLERANPQDVLIYKKETDIKEDGAFNIGTGSLRRQYQIKELYRNAYCTNLRGNIGTRINKLKNGDYDAIILAKAGIQRQGLDKDKELDYKLLSVEDMLPAAGQGIIAIETSDSGIAYEMANAISHQETQFRLMVERAMLLKLGASCHEPIGVYATVNDEQLKINLMRVVNDKIIRNCVSGNKSNWGQMIENICKD
jgi:hydroxymethylbilane synthase